MIPLEDNVGDIIGKAQRGLGIADSKLAEKAHVAPETIRKLREGDVDEAALLSVAPILGLNAQALCELAKGEWHPEKIEMHDGVSQFNTDYHGMAVNAYLVWDLASHGAAAFDTGADSSEMIRFANRHKLDVQLILEKILTLSDDTIICPGHGPMTTVGEEKEHNPFFAGRI